MSDGPGSTQHFVEAARAFVAQVEGIGADRWNGPGLGAWDLRALVGHTSRSLITVETYLHQPAEREDLASPEAYYAAIAGILRADVDADAIVERGRAAGQALGDDPPATVTALAERVTALVERDDDPLITTIAGGMRLSTYLPTRTFELVVHGLDIAAATGLEPPTWSSEVLAEVVTAGARAAVLEGSGLPLILALTGRATLPAGFSIV